MFLLIHRYLDGPDEPLARIIVCGVVRHRQRLEHVYQIFVGVLLELRTQSRIGRHLRYCIVPRHRLDVQPRAAAENHRTAAGDDIIVRRREIPLIPEDIIAHPRIHDVYQMIRHRPSLIHILAEILPGPNIHPAVYLPRVSRDNLSTGLPRQPHRIAGLARSRRPQDHRQTIFFQITAHNIIVLFA